MDEHEINQAETDNKPEIDPTAEANTTGGENEMQAESALEVAENALAEQKDKFLRLFAEFDNYKKRVAKEKLEYMSMAGKDVLLEMISVKDDFERALRSLENSDDLSAMREGIQLIFDKLNKGIERKGVLKIEAIGQPFDVEKHEAITEIPAASEDQKGLVIDEIESGYILHDKVIRFAKVVVGR